ncbi:MAG: hypothetical protein SFU25_03875, partial [Candidatus Caenarcaniphilales bacterium]|nr:hypothetical protein [Candidatus Caenarcaniphilales bacterium]
NALSMLRFAFDDSGLVNLNGLTLRQVNNEVGSDRWKILGNYVPNWGVELGLFSSLKPFNSIVNEKRISIGDVKPPQDEQQLELLPSDQYSGVLQSRGFTVSSNPQEFYAHADSLYRRSLSILETGFESLEKGSTQYWSPEFAESENQSLITPKSKVISLDEAYAQLTPADKVWLAMRYMGILQRGQKPINKQIYKTVVEPLDKQCEVNLQKKGKITPGFLIKCLTFKEGTNELVGIALPPTTEEFLDEWVRLDIARQILEQLKDLPEAERPKIIVPVEFLEEPKTNTEILPVKTPSTLILIGKNPRADVSLLSSDIKDLLHQKLQAGIQNTSQTSISSADLGTPREILSDIGLYLIRGLPYVYHKRAIEEQTQEQALSAAKEFGIQVSSFSVGRLKVARDKANTMRNIAMKALFNDLFGGTTTPEGKKFTMLAGCLPCASYVVDPRTNKILYLTEAGLEDSSHFQSGAIKAAQILFDYYLASVPDIGRIKYEKATDIKNYYSFMDNSARSISGLLNPSTEKNPTVLKRQKMSFLAHIPENIYLTANRFGIGVENLITFVGSNNEVTSRIHEDLLEPWNHKLKDSIQTNEEIDIALNTFIILIKELQEQLKNL